MAPVSSYTTSEGKRYRVRYRKPDHTQTDKRGFRTKRDADLFAASVEISKARGDYIDASAARATVGELGEAWLKTRSHLKPSSLRPIEIAWRIYVMPTWRHVSVGDIRHSDVQAWVAEIGEGRSATTVLRAYGVLAGVLDVAVKDRRLPGNPARGVSLPRKRRKSRAYLTHAQVQLLADSAKKQSALVLFLAYTGLRWGEAVALRVGHVDRAKRRINVTENAVNVGGTIIVGTPKTHAARSVPYPEFLDRSIATLCEGKVRDQFLFGDGTTYIKRPDQRRGWFVGAIRHARAIDTTFPTITLHDLRHTAASLAVSAGANVKAIQRMLGHASAAMTLDIYADLFDDDLDSVAQSLNQAKLRSDVGKMWAPELPKQDETPVMYQDISDVSASGHL